MFARVLFGLIFAAVLTLSVQARESTIRINGTVEPVMSTTYVQELRRGCDAYTLNQQRECVEMIDMVDTMFENARQVGLQGAMASYIADTQNAAYRSVQSADNNRAHRQLEVAREKGREFVRKYPLALGN